MVQAMSSEELVFLAHLGSGRFRSGVAAKRWRHVSTDWPFAIFGVTAADGLEYGLRFDLTGYPRTEATARLWDLRANAQLQFANWPAGQNRIPLAFNPGWKDGACLYLPCDRMSLDGHPNWLHEHPSLLWDATTGFIQYLRIVHDLLNSGDYGGRRAA
jgi:hypothetical protein